jgi:hypothetical protein
MSITTAQYSNALEPIVRNWYGTAYKQYDDLFKKVFDVRTSKKAVETTMSQMGTGLFTVKGQGSPISMDTTKELYKSTHTHIAYSKGLRFTREMMEDELYNIMKSMAGNMKRSEKHTVEILAANVFNNGFDSGYTGSDGVELFSLLHPLGGGGTAANEPTTAVDLSTDSIEQAKIDIYGWTDDRGLKFRATGKFLMVHPANEANARRVLESQRDPDSANNAINPSYKSLELIVNPFLTDTDAWYIITDVGDSLVFYWRRMPDFQRDNDTMTQDMLMLATFRMSVGWDDWRGAYGSPGI